LHHDDADNNAHGKDKCPRSGLVIKGPDRVQQSKEPDPGQCPAGKSLHSEPLRSHDLEYRIFDVVTEMVAVATVVILYVLGIVRGPVTVPAVEALHATCVSGLGTVLPGPYQITGPEPELQASFMQATDHRTRALPSRGKPPPSSTTGIWDTSGSLKVHM